MSDATGADAVSIVSVSASPASPTVATGSAVGVFATAITTSPATLTWTWTSSNPAVATVVKASGLRADMTGGGALDETSSATITGVTPGHADVTVEARIGDSSKVAVIGVNVMLTVVCNRPTVLADDFESVQKWFPIYPIAPSGGNPGGYKRVQIQLGQGALLGGFNTLDVEYDPGLPGNAIDHINYSEDRIQFDPPYPGAVIGSGLVVIQGSIRRTKDIDPPTAAFSNTTWETRAATFTAADLTGINLSGGGPIMFAALRSLHNVSVGTVTFTHGLDNFKVEICH